MKKNSARKIAWVTISVFVCQNTFLKYPVLSKETVEAAAREIFNIPKSTEVHLWSLTTNEEFEALTQKKQTIQEMSLSSNQVVVVEPQNSDGSWPRKMKTLSYKRYISLIRKDPEGLGLIIFLDVNLGLIQPGLLIRGRYFFVTTLP